MVYSAECERRWYNTVILPATFDSRHLQTVVRQLYHVWTPRGVRPLLGEGDAIYLLLEDGQPVDVLKPVVVLNVVDAVDKVAIATREVFLNHVIKQVTQVGREELGKLELNERNNTVMAASNVPPSANAN